MILKNHLTNGYFVDVAIFLQQFMLAPLGIAFVCLFIGTYPDIQISYFHWLYLLFCGCVPDIHDNTVLGLQKLACVGYL